MGDDSTYGFEVTDCCVDSANTFLGSKRSRLSFSGFKYFSQTTKISADSRRDAAGFQTCTCKGHCD